MKLENSTTWPDEFLRHMMAWVFRELDMPARTIKHARFRNSRSHWGGLARSWKRQISVCVSADERNFPADCSGHARRGRCPPDAYADRMECLIAITAHESYHVAAAHVPAHQQKTRGRSTFASSEPATCAAHMRVLYAFRANRAALMAEWTATPAPAVIVPEIAQSDAANAMQIKRATAAIAKMERWAKRMRAATNKFNKYRRTVRYYERTLGAAAIGNPNTAKSTKGK